MSTSIFLPTGTGSQGRYVAQQFLARGDAVHVLSRKPDSAIAQELQSLGATLHIGDLDSTHVIEHALKLVNAVFLSMPAIPDAEVRRVKFIIDAARRNKQIKTLVYTGVARTGEHEEFPGWNDDYPMAWFWKNKAIIQDMVCTAAFENWTIIHPALFTQNFCSPMVDLMHPGLADVHELRVVYGPDTLVDIVIAVDIARFVVAAVDAPAKFSGKIIPLTSEKLTADQIAEALSEISGENIKVVHMGKEDEQALREQGWLPLDAQIWQRDVGYGVDIEALKQYGVPLTPLTKALDKAALGW
ncbi:NAD(P)-binding protein [Plenodomus tracheiphilus IPT5]|uniref:NAD(P)-binding protein n=1 Tax=Plenodomus tracheiphilus IPT5 TaxID=1408161 RepID=A0A6A7B9N8_9PLEO|nr:NAD(P)-binding protein [Plenodomus tracheiphilus IPT5]